MSPTWHCPNCSRRFARKHQRHACGTGNRAEVLRNRSDAVVGLYASLEAYVLSLGPVEIVARDRYVLFRTTRIFADLSVMVGGLRLAIHTLEDADDPVFFKQVRDGARFTHVMKVTDAASLEASKKYLQQAYAFSLR